MTEQEFEEIYNTIAAQFGEDLALARSEADELLERANSAITEIAYFGHRLSARMSYLYSQYSTDINAAWKHYQTMPPFPSPQHLLTSPSPDKKRVAQ